jgi:hypothetical protein
MKKFTVVLMGCMLTLAMTAIAEPSEADQKWLKAVEKMLAKGEKKVSTHDESRVKLLKEWAKKEGYDLEVTKVDEGFRVEFSKKKDIAQK